MLATDDLFSCLSFFLFCDLFMCMNILPTCMDVYHVRGWCSQRSEEDPGTGVTDGCELSWWGVLGIETSDIS